MRYDYHLIVIGAGSAGLSCGAAGAALGASVLLAEQGQMGGDCLNYGCVPSKSFLKGAHLAKEMSQGEMFGIHPGQVRLDSMELLKRVSHVVQAIAPHDSQERFEKMGVTVKRSFAKLADGHSILVGGERFTGKSIIICTGSTARVPQIPGLLQVPYQTNKTIFRLERAPEHLVILGAGPIGLELGQGFAHMGTKVTIIDRSCRLFQKDEPEVGRLMEAVLKEDGINLLLNATIQEVRQKGQEIAAVVEAGGNRFEILGDQLLICPGRIPVTDGLGLERAGVAVGGNGHIITDRTMRTSLPSVFACGDVAGPYLFTHMAGAQASIAVRNALFGLRAKINYRNAAWCTYTRPEVAHVGCTKQEAVDKGIFKKAYVIPMEDNDRAVAENDTRGFLKVITSPGGRVIGATLVGNKAGELIAPACHAVTKRLKATQFLAPVYPYPTESEIYKNVGIRALKDGGAAWQMKLLKKIMGCTNK